MRKVLVIIAVFFLFALPVHAGYVLPYPSYMPGNKLYKISRAVDFLKKWWYWGNIASVKYNLKLADKYLVEARILFEYQQYPLAIDALSRSTSHVGNIVIYLIRAQQEGKDMRELKTFVSSAMDAHIALLDKLSQELPENFVWIPERQPSSVLHLSQLLHDATIERKKLVE